MCLGSPKDNTERDPQTLDELRLQLIKNPNHSADIRPSGRDLAGMGLPSNWCQPSPEHDVECLIARLFASPDLARLVREALDPEGEL